MLQRFKANLELNSDKLELNSNKLKLNYNPRKVLRRQVNAQHEQSRPIIHDCRLAVLDYRTHELNELTLI